MIGTRLNRQGNAGITVAWLHGRRASFHPRAVFGPNSAATLWGFFSSLRHLNRAVHPPLRAAAAWRSLSGTFRTGFYSEAEAQRRTLGPRLPHHRHPITADEALAGIVTVIVLVGVLIYVLAKSL